MRAEAVTWFPSAAELALFTQLQEAVRARGAGLLWVNLYDVWIKWDSAARLRRRGAPHEAAFATANAYFEETFGTKPQQFFELLSPLATATATTDSTTN